MKKKAFTLLELVVVIIIIGILATLAFRQYTRFIEKSRAAEARAILGQLRDAEWIYYERYTTFTILNLLPIDSSLPTAYGGGTCKPSHYFLYGATADSSTFTITATRCTGGGKPPQFRGQAYYLTIDQDGNLTSPSGY